MIFDLITTKQICIGLSVVPKRFTNTVENPWFSSSDLTSSTSISVEIPLMMTFMVRSPGKLNVWNGMLCSFNMRCASLKMEGFAVCMRMLLSDEILAIIESELMVLKNFGAIFRQSMDFSIMGGGFGMRGACSDCSVRSVYHVYLGLAICL